MTAFETEIWTAKFWSKLAVKTISDIDTDEEGSNSGPYRRRVAKHYRMLAQKHLQIARDMIASGRRAAA